jgi:hypothetical protein
MVLLRLSGREISFNADTFPPRIDSSQLNRLPAATRIGARTAAVCLFVHFIDDKNFASEGAQHVFQE